MAGGIRTRRLPMWTIALSDAVTTNQRLVGTLRRVPARLVYDQHGEADVRLIRLSQPLARGSEDRIPRVIVADAVDEVVVRAVMRSGAAGIISPDVSVEEARAILSAAVARYFPIPHHLASALASRLEPPSAIVLTDRDRIILKHLARGDTIATIARRLGCSQRHARRHLRTLWDKMDVPGRAQGLITATRQGLLNS